MRVYLLLAVSVLTLTASFLHTGDADHAPTLADKTQLRLEQLEREKDIWRSEKLNYEKMKLEWAETKQQCQDETAEFENMKRDWQEIKRQWKAETEIRRNENIQWDRDIQELKQIKSYFNKNPYYIENKSQVKMPSHRAFQHETKPVESSATHVITRADDLGAWEPVVGQMSQRLTEVAAEMQSTKNDVQTLRNVNTQQDQAILESRASVFVRWGRSVCPSSDSLVYSGVLGGSWYDDTGAAVNYLCLSMSPVAGTHTLPNEMALLYGGEYQTDFDSHNQQNAPCAVCRSQRSTTLMVPGTNQCPSGWTVEYNGYLMANAHNYGAASEYICVDSYFEERPAGGANENGKLLFFTLTRCGSLPCPPYRENTLVTCAVCSK